MENNLSIEQQLAAYTSEKRVLVAASAGSGKTRTLIERVNYLLYEKNVDPSKIFCITFTNMAAEEMKLRLGDKGGQCFVGTIHSLANRILLINGISTFEVIEKEEFDRFFEMLQDNIENIKIPEVEHLLVDEFQDVCDNEYDFMINILKPQNFWFCGDSRQSIYGFKGSNFQFFIDLTADPFTEVYELCDCYRCGPEIIDFANYQIKDVRSIYRTPTHCFKSYGNAEVDEDEFGYGAVFETIQQINNYRETAVLCRSNNMVDDMLFFLKRHGIPAVTFKKANKSFAELQSDMEANTVKVLTVHSAKGLEWDNVIVCQEYNAWNDEEKRINYVAATRARNYLLWLKVQRKRPGRKKTSYAQSYMDSQMKEW